MAKIYLDSCVVIGLIEGSAKQRQVLKRHLFNHYLFSSELVRLEARVLVLRENNQFALKQYNSFFDACEMVNLDRSVFECATILRVEKQIKIPDALHLASAIISNCDEFWTNDLRLASYAATKIQVKDWNQLEQQE